MKDENKKKDPKRFVFTEKKVRDIKPAEKDKERYYDTKMPGLCLIVTPRGKKTYVVYKKVNGKTRTIKIYTSPSITVDTARGLAQEVMVKLARGEDPVKSEKLKWTLEKWISEYIKDRKLAINTQQQYIRACKNYSFKFYRQALTKITSETVLTVYRDICDGNLSWIQDDGSMYKMRKGSPSQANLWARAIRAVFNFAIGETETDDQSSPISRNPVSVLSRKKSWVDVSRKKTRIRDAHLNLLIDAIDTVLVDSLISGLESRAAFCDRLIFLLFTGLRKIEAQNLTWDRVALHDRYFWIKETKNDCPIELPLTDTLYLVLKRRKELSGNNLFVFGIDKDVAPVKDARKTIDVILSELQRREKERAMEFGYEENPDVYKKFTEQDLRRTYGSIAFTQLGSVYLIKRLLNHTISDKEDVTMGYLSASSDELRGITRTIEQFILYDSSKSQNDAYPDEVENEV